MDMVRCMIFLPQLTNITEFYRGADVACPVEWRQCGWRQYGWRMFRPHGWKPWSGLSEANPDFA
jgi:hypothetical protein